MRHAGGMAREIPEAVRAAAGLVATVLDEARKLPGELPHLPVRLLGLAMQGSLRLQQQYSGLVARGDEVFTGLWGDAEPGLATFDEDLPEPAPPTANRSSPFDRAPAPEAAPVEDIVTVADVGDVTGDPADLTVELTDEIADLSGTSELADIADLAAAAAEDAAEDAGRGAEDGEPLADVLAFETIAGNGDEITDAQAAALPADPPADVVTKAVDELAEEVDAELAVELPESVSDEAADDLAADTVATAADAEVAADSATDESVDGAPGSVPDGSTVRDLGLLGTADATGPDVEIPDLGLEDTGPAADAAPTAPVPGYDGFSIPALRGHLRGYTAETVADLLDYERAHQARPPYVTLLQNRLEKLSADRG
ncbi:MAG: hypothetical protein JWR62_469 [Modestobacter sp.]|nr:hypothetical protein [Modestobacter sp.]